MKTVYTTTQAAKLMRVSGHAVRTLCDAGELPCFRLSARRPGGAQHRRITREALLAKMREWGIPVPAELEG